MVRLRRVRRLSLLIVPGVLLAACGGATAPSIGQVAKHAAAVIGGPSRGTVVSTPPAALATPVSATCDTAPAVDTAAFPTTPRIDNRYLPLTPGKQYLLDGAVVGDDGKKHPHRIETTVTDLTKTIDGVHTVVVFDRDLEDGAMQESEIYFEAQDGTGTVWNFGEYPEEYANGTLKGAPRSWLPGVAGAVPGISMPAHPQTGTATYTEGLAPAVPFKDCATVVGLGRTTCAISNVGSPPAVAPRSDGTLDLSFGNAGKVLNNFDAGLDYIDALALQEDQRAYTTRGDVWSGTEAGSQTLSAPC